MVVAKKFEASIIPIVFPAHGYDIVNGAMLGNPGAFAHGAKASELKRRLRPFLLKKV